MLAPGQAFTLETVYHKTQVQAAGLITAVAFSGILGTVVVSKLGWEPRDVLVFYGPLLLISATGTLLVAFFASGSLVGYIVAVCLQHLIVFGPNMALYAEFPQDLADVAGMASCIQLSGSCILASLFSLPGLAAAAGQAISHN